MFGRGSRSHWNLDGDCIFLNHGSFGATPRVVLAEQGRWQQELERQPVAFMAQELLPLLDRSRLVLGGFVGANPQNLVFVDNATTGINTVLRSIPWQEGDKILTTNHVYGAVRQALKFIRNRYGVVVTEVAIPFPEFNIYEHLFPYCQADLCLIVIDHITSPTALIFPIDEIIKYAHDRGIPVLIDGAHAPGMVDLHLEELRPDWYVGNCHKWLCSSKGCGFIYTAPPWQGITHPLTISHDYGGGYQEEFGWMGTRDFSSWLALPKAIEFLQSLGIEQIHKYNHNLVKQGGTILAETLGIKEIPTRIGAMLTLPIPDFHDGKELHDRLLREHRIEVPIIPWQNNFYVRISAQIYNELPEYEILALALQTKA